MPNVVRFALSTARYLEVPGAGAFMAGILDVPADDVLLVDRTRYLVEPYRAVELGVVDAATPYPDLPATGPGEPDPDPYPQYGKLAGDNEWAGAQDFSGATVTGIGGGGVSDATTTTKGIIQLSGDLSGDALNPTVPGLLSRAPINSPSFTGTVSGVSKAMVGLGNADNTADASKPVSTAQQAAIDAAKARSSHTGTQLASTISDFTETAQDAAAAMIAAGTHVGIAASYNDAGNALSLTATGTTSPDATTSTKGIVQLAGDLAGTSAAPTVPGLAGKAATSHTHAVTDLTATGTRSSSTYLRGDNTWATPGGGSGSSLNAAADKIRYVSSAGSDSNDGLSWATAKLTIGAAHTALAGAGTILVGGGTYAMAPGFTPANGTIIQGAGADVTRINLNANGNMFSLVNTVGLVLQDLSLGFASGSVTGTLLHFSNAFGCRINRVTLVGNGSLGVGTTNQRGVFFTANSGDNTFFHCFFSTLAVGILADTVVNWVTDCQFFACKIAITGGSPSGATSGLFISGCIFNEVGDCFIDITGIAQAWIIDRCWFEVATICIRVGTTGGLGPTLFSLTNCSIGAGGATSVILNAAETTVIDGIQFINVGSTPVDLSIPVPANLPYGTIGQINSYNRTSEAIRALVPAQWEGSGRVAKRTITGAYTVTNADGKGYALHSTAGSGFTLTVPQDSAATSLAVDTAIPWRQYGSGQITFAAGTGASLVSRGSVFKSAGQYAEGLLTKTAANTWLLSGDIVA